MGKLYDYMKEKKMGFIHITEYSNLQSIIENGGIYSLENLEKKEIDVKYVSSLDSRGIDKYKGLHKYVRLAYTRQYDMIAAAVGKNEMKNPVIIGISPEILKLSNLKFTKENAVKNGCILYNEEDKVFHLLDFDKIYEKRTWKNIDQVHKDARQSEVLVENIVEVDYFVYIIINEYNDESSLKIPKNIKILKENTNKLINSL